MTVTDAQKKFAEAARRYKELKQALAQHTGPPQVGDLFLFPGAAQLPFRWAIVLRHPDRPLLYAVPADTAPFVGSADVEVAEQEMGGAMVLRCAFGLWVEEKDFQMRLRVGVLEPRYVERARVKIEQLASGRSLEGTALQQETDASPSYDEWIDEVVTATYSLQGMLREDK